MKVKSEVSLKSEVNNISLQVTNLLYQLFTIDSTDHTEMVSPSHLSRHEKKLSPPPPPHQLSSNEKR